MLLSGNIITVKFFRQIILSFFVITSFVVFGLVVNLRPQALLVAAQHEIEEEWEEFVNVVAFQDALNNLIYSLSSHQFNFSSADPRDILSIDDMKDKLSQIKVCAINLPIGGKNEETHHEQEQAKIDLLKKEVDSFISEFSRDENSLREYHRLREMIDRLFYIKSVSKDLQQVHSDGVFESLALAERMGKIFNVRMISVSLIIVSIMIILSVVFVLILRKTAEEEIDRQKMRIIVMLAQSLAHEIRNPLGIIMSSASVIKRDVQSRQSRELADYLIEEVERINDLLNQLLDLGAPRKMDMGYEDISGIINAVINLLKADLDKSNIHINYQDQGRGVKVLCSKNQIKQLMINLLLNAVDASCPGGVIDVITDAGPRGYRIVVRDHGKGLDTAAREKIFDPFYTTKAKGTGLGMTLVKKITDDHHARISIESKVNEGACFTIYLKINGRKKEN